MFFTHIHDIVLSFTCYTCTCMYVVHVDSSWYTQITECISTHTCVLFLCGEGKPLIGDCTPSVQFSLCCIVCNILEWLDISFVSVKGRLNTNKDNYWCICVLQVCTSQAWLRSVNLLHMCIQHVWGQHIVAGDSKCSATGMWYKSLSFACRTTFHWHVDIHVACVEICSHLCSCTWWERASHRQGS